MFSRFALGLSIIAFAWAQASFGNEAFSDVRIEAPTEEHAEVGSRPLPPEKQEALNIQKGEAITELREQFETNAPASDHAIPLSLQQSQVRLQPIYYSYAHHTHYLIGVSPDGRFIELEDKSRFDIAPGSNYQVLRWLGDQTYTITPNYNWFSYLDYAYTIINNETGESVKANLIVGPELSNPYTKYIISINYTLGLAYLSDGTVWEVAGDDTSYFNEWAVNDIVIIGDYSPWFYCLYPYDSILINVNMNHYVHAKQN